MSDNANDVMFGSRWIKTEYLGMRRDISIGYVGDKRVGYNDCGSMNMAYIDKDDLFNNYTQLSEDDVKELYK